MDELVWWGAELLRVLLLAAVLAGLLLLLAHIYYRVKFLHAVVRIFEEKPLFIVPKGRPEPGAEDVRFATEDGLTLCGCYLSARPPRRGVILFGLEFGSNRWASVQYCARLREAGFDVFAFEPRNQGESDKDAAYAPLQWVTDKDLADMRAALAYLKARPDAPADGVGVLGVSKGGSVGLLAAADDPWVRCVATDGAYATYTTMVPYMRRWASIYSPRKWLQERLPDWFYGTVGRVAIREAATRRAVQFLSVEKAVKRLRQPLLMIHGGADTYIKPAMAEKLFARAGSKDKALWLVPQAKHNQALHAAGDEYHRRLLAFFGRHLPGQSAAPTPPDGTPGLLAAAGADYIMSLTRFLLVRFGRLVALPIHRRIARFERDCEDPERVQADLLRRILARQAATAFGRDHHFASVRSAADYRRHVPVAPYEYVEPYVERVKKGETDALIVGDEVLMFALTSGTTAARKLIPVTRRYLADYRRGWNMWGVRAYRDHRGRGLSFRPIVQMVGDPEEYRTESGIPCGNLSGFTAQVQKRMIRRLYVVPGISGKVKDARSRYYLALRLALPRPCALFLAANPSTLVMLGRVLDQEKENLLRDVREGTLSADLDLPAEVRAYVAPRLKARPERARELSAIAEKAGRLFPRDVWPPETTLIGTWTGGSMGPYLRQLPRYFGDPPVRDLGLLASEGRMTIPFANDTPAGVLDVWSHYFEFVPEGEADSKDPTVLGAHELEEGKSYFIVPTTASGLYRYQISDLVRVRDFLGRTPVVEFLGKGHRFANLTGEKLSEHQVTQAMEAAARRTGLHVGGYTLAPVWDDERPYYGLFVEEPDAADGAALKHFLAEYDRSLGELNIEYAAKRESARLGPVRALVLPAGTWTKWDRDRLAQTGGSPEQYKHPCLIGGLKFKDTLPVLREVT